MGIIPRSKAKSSQSTPGGWMQYEHLYVGKRNVVHPKNSKRPLKSIFPPKNNYIEIVNLGLVLLANICSSLKASPLSRPQDVGRIYVDVT